MSTLDRRELERLRFWQGQALLDRDFNDHLQLEAHRRWWHNRAIHNAYGVATGFEATFDGGTVRVAPGIAYDCFGRELYLQEEHRLPIPDPVASGEQSEPSWMLVISYRETPEIAAADSACKNRRSPIERPKLAWRREREWDPRDGVPLARGAYSLNDFVVDPVVRPRARALARPLVASGFTVQGNTAWKAWPPEEQGAAPNDPAITMVASPGVLVRFLQASAGGIEVTVDTSAAGFTETPCYFAALQRVPSDRAQRSFELVALDRILDPTPSSFTYSLLISEQSEAAKLGSFARRHFYVGWIGVQTFGSGERTLEEDHGSS